MNPSSSRVVLELIAAVTHTADPRVPNIARRYVTMTACGAVAVAQMATTIYLPSLPSMGRDLGIGIGTLQLSIALFVVFAAVPVVLWGRLAERFGRVSAFVVAGVVFILASVGLAAVHDTAQLLCLRILQAVGAGGLAVIARMMVKDLFSGSELARHLSLLSMAFVVALGGGQVLGGVITSTVGWRYTFVVLALVAIVPVALVLRVSLPRTGSATGTKGVAKRLFRDRTFVVSSVAGGIGFAIIVLIQQRSAFIFVGYFALRPWIFGLFGILYGLSYFVGATYVHRVVRRTGACALIRQGAVVMLAGCVLIAIVWFVDPPRAIALPVFLLGYVAATFGQATLFPNTSAHAVSHLMTGGAIAVSWCALVQQGLAGVASFAGPLAEGLATWSVVLCTLAAANVILVVAPRRCAD